MRLLFGQFRDKTGIPSRQSLGTPVSGYPVNCSGKSLDKHDVLLYYTISNKNVILITGKLWKIQRLCPLSIMIR